MPIKKYLLALTAATCVMAAQQEQPTPYDLIRPTWPLTWDESAFNRFDTTVTKKKNMVPKNRTPASYKANELIPDTLNQAYLDNINTHMSPIRINQAGYLEKDVERQFYYVGTATNFEVVDVNGNSLSPAVTGTLTSSGGTTSSNWSIIAGTNAATNDQKRYQVDITGQSGTIMVGRIPQGVPTETRLRIKVGNDISSTFIVSDKVYSMIRSAALKFYGINRSGNGESWFHPASHTKDGGGPIVTGADDVRGPFNEALAGTLEGGYYDCGDHLKESQTQMYAFMAAAVMAATNADADDDAYAFNQGETVNTDGIPDMLREAKHGADFVLRAYNRAKGVIDDMALSVGNFGSDHAWWGRPENQDKLPVDNSASATDRGGPASRTVRLGEIGANIGGETAAGLAILGKDYAIYDKAFADSCLMVAEKMYEFAKSMAQGKTYKNNTKAAGWSSPAYNGNNEFYDDMALASVALLYATGKKEYADDMIRTRNMVQGQEYMDGAGFFQGGWFVTNNKGFFKDVKNTSWANCYAFALYALYKLILSDKEKAINVYGLTETEWLNAVEDCVADMIANLGDMGFQQGQSEQLVLPGNPSIWKPATVYYDKIWYTMHTDQTWIYNRYQMGNIFEIFAYADVANDLASKNITLPILGNPDWKAGEAFQLGINQMNYMLGVNPWDVSFILGVGDKNDAHPHHRAANPEGKNVPGAAYKYNPPTGALFGGVAPGSMNSWVPDNKSWEDYHLSETCIDAAATLVSASMLASQKIDRTLAPDINVEIRHVSMDSAIVMIKLTQRGTATISYGTQEGQYNLTATGEKPGVQHEITLRDLKPGTAYYFYVTGSNAYVPENTKTKYLVDSTQTPFTFTTLNTVENANIANVTVCNISADSAEIMWYTPNGEYESKVYWDTKPHSTAEEFAYNTGKGNADISGIPTKFHYVKIGGLKEKTTYYYMVESNGAQSTVDDNGALLKFTTPVTQYDFSVRTYQYEWDGKPAINMNIFNNEARPFDSLTVRMYMRGDDDLYDDVAIRTDICQAYDEAGFNKACDASTLANLNEGFRHARPVKIEDTYDEATKTWQWYFPIPLGSTVIKSSSRFRVDVLFVARIRAVGQDDPLDTPPQNKRLYCRSGNKWHWVTDITSQESLNENPGDWSWMPHSRTNQEEKDFNGMPCEEKDAGDIDLDLAPENPYVSVYRKDEFVWGYSPSKKEMQTKRANYKIDVTLDPPFNVSNGSYVAIDQGSSTVKVTGLAHVTEGGYITKVWANGQKVSGITFVDGLTKWLMNEAGTDTIASYDIASDMWRLNIPVKMGIGSNKVDITIFAGPDPTCDACTENGGCAFENRTYYVQFSKGDMTMSSLTIKDAAGNAIVSPAAPEGTTFFIDLIDKDKVKKNTQTIDVQVINSKKNDKLTVTLTADPASPGRFTGGPIVAINKTKESRNPTSEISFFAGDTIQVIYTDPEDEDDVQKQTFYAISKIPTPQKVLAEDSDCDNKTDRLHIVFNNNLTEEYTLDSIRYFFDGMADTVKMALKAADYLNKNEAVIAIDTSRIPTTPTPSGKITVFVGSSSGLNSESLKITDGIKPTLTSVSILEKSDSDRSGNDTIMVAFSEPVILPSESDWPLAIAGAAGVPTVIGKGITTNDGKSWQFVISGNVNNSLVPIGAQASALATSNITDHSFNALDPAGCNPSVPVTLISRPVPIRHAEMIDKEGDGIPDIVYMMFEKKLKPKDLSDSIVVVWGDPGITRSYITTADTTGGVIKPNETYWTIRDTSSAAITVTIDSVTTKDSIPTYSIIEITIPSDKAFPYGATSGENDGNGSVSPLKGQASGFFETTFTLYDKCPPVISTASMIEDRLSVTTSEPLNIIPGATRFIQREREELIPDGSPISSGKVQLFTFGENTDVIHAGDRIRLVPEVLGAGYTDKAGLTPTPMNPYVRVTGDENVKFTITLEDAVTKPTTQTPYVGLPEVLVDEDNLITIFQDGKVTFLDGEGNIVGTTDSASYYRAGPQFWTSISIPSAGFKTRDGIPMYNYEINITMDIFDNVGQYINTNKVHIKSENFANLKNFTDGGILNLNLEWKAKDGEAPVSKEGKKIGTGAFIAKFDYTATSYCAAVFDSNSNDYNQSCKAIGDKVEKNSGTKTKTFGFMRAKK